jgi:hypothetical protein
MLRVCGLRRKTPVVTCRVNPDTFLADSTWSKPSICRVRGFARDARRRHSWVDPNLLKSTSSHLSRSVSPAGIWSGRPDKLLKSTSSSLSRSVSPAVTCRVDPTSSRSQLHRSFVFGFARRRSSVEYDTREYEKSGKSDGRPFVRFCAAFLWSAGCPSGHNCHAENEITRDRSAVRS